MKRVLRCFMICLVFGSCFLHAQIRMEFDAASNNTPFRVRYGDTLVYNLLLINTDLNQTFGGNVYAGFFGSNNISPDSVLIGTFQIPPSDTVRSKISIEVVPNYFKEGPEVVVVWPIFNGDRGTQLADFIFVKGGISFVNDFVDSPFVYLANQEIIALEHNLKQVRIFALTGQVVAAFSPNARQFSLPALPRSLYLLHVVTDDDKVSVMKFFGKN